MFLAVEVRQAPPQRTLPFAFEIRHHLPGVDAAGDKLRALDSHFAEHAFAAFVDEGDVREINNTPSPVRFEARLLIRLKFGNPGPG